MENPFRSTEHVRQRRVKKTTSRAEVHRFEFQARFRRHAFGWKSQPAIVRIKQAVTEIKRLARQKPELAAEGAMRFLERVSPAIEQVDSSSGTIGTAVSRAIEELAAIIEAAPAATETRLEWLERLWKAYQDDGIPYLETLVDHWGALCGTRESAIAWLDQAQGAMLADGADQAWLGAMVRAERHEQLLVVLRRAPLEWNIQRHAVDALLATGRREEALAIAEACSARSALPDPSIACEKILLSLGRTEEAYVRHALAASTRSTYTATFRELRRKYPEKAAADVLADLVRASPSEAGKWFAAAKDAGLFGEALALARRSPCDPRTLARAARDHGTTHAEFAVNAGLLALHGMVAGQAYELEGRDIRMAYDGTMAAAEQLGSSGEVEASVRKVAAAGGLLASYVASVLPKERGA
ncbi:MAG TPA: hypothetical protein VFZ65_04575 [Planctomycetota bacterium]|nr:hypothetical protein [Planctomycetota bacterium]